MDTAITEMKRLGDELGAITERIQQINRKLDMLEAAKPQGSGRQVRRELERWQQKVDKLLGELVTLQSNGKVIRDRLVTVMREVKNCAGGE